MDKEDVTLDDIKAMAMNDDVGGVVAMLVSGSTPVQHLALAAQLYTHALELDQQAKRLRAIATEPEHRELADSMRCAARAARLAFDAAANAVCQLYWLANHCECDECVEHRRRDNAELN